MPTGIITFPGITAPQYAICTRTIGARPDTSVIYAQPQPGSPDCTGTATFQVGFNGNIVTMNNALCEQGTLSISTHGHLQIFEIKDRRWRWLKSYITQAYNVRNPDGTIISATQKTLSQIISAIFAKMGEPTVDVSLVTSTELPELIYDHDSCVDSIEELLGQRGYAISLNIDDTIKIFPRGVGATLPNNGDLVSAAISVNPPEIPENITACGNKTLVQSMLFCGPVGLDTDGSIKQVSALSYAPAGGFDGTDLETFNFIADPIARECARRSVGKWYQVTSQGDRTQNIKKGAVDYASSTGEISVSQADQYLPIEKNLLRANNDVFGNVSPNPAYVLGTFLSVFGNPPQMVNTPDFTRVDQRDWELDEARGIVMFRELALMTRTVLRAPGIQTFAEVNLMCAYAIHPSTTFIKDRLIRQLNLGGYGEDLRKVTEIQRQIVVSYTPGTSTVSSIADNKTAQNAAADLYLNAAAYAYQIAASNVLLYRGIQTFNTDGVALQLRWDCAVPGPCPWGTHVAQNAEGLPLLPTQSERALKRKVGQSSNPMNRKRWKFHQGKHKLL